MDLLSFLVMSAVGVGAFTWLVRRLDRSAPAALDEEKVRARFAEDFPAETVRQVVPSLDARAALVELARPDAFGLVVRLGHRLTTRCLGARQLASVDAHAGRLRLTLDDFTLPRVELALGDASDAWRERLLAEPGDA